MKNISQLVVYLLLVGGIPTPLKNMKVSWAYYSQYMKTYIMFQTTNQYMLNNYKPMDKPF
jgi:hypothetical protein